MNISINCKLSLSKKLRALLTSKEASLTLVSQDIIDGKGTAILSLASESIANIDPETIGETSLMLIPVEIAEESPNAQSPVHATIFSTVISNKESSPVVKKIASVNAPEKGEESRAIKETAEVPSAFSELKEKECTTWIKNMEDLIEAAQVAKNKQSSVDLNAAQNDRERAVMLEIKEKEEAIDIPAWIINDKAGMLSINDLNISLPLNAPFDLSNISAKRIIASKDLRGLLKLGYVRFLSPKEKDEFIIGSNEETEKALGLPVFDNHEEAMDNMGTSVEGKLPIIDEKNAMDVTESDIEKPTEDENMILNLTQNMPTVKTASVPSGSKRTVHGNFIQSETPKNPAIKPIKKIEK